MKTHAFTLIVAVLLASQVEAETIVETPPIDSPINGRDVTLASVGEPKIEEGSTPDGVKADQVFTDALDTTDPAYTIAVGAEDTKPVLSVGRKMLGLSDPTSLTDHGALSLTGDGVQAGSGGNGVTTTLSGHGGGGIENGQFSDAHIEPHGDDTTVTAAGESVSNCAELNPDNAAGEGPPLVKEGCK